MEERRQGRLLRPPNLRPQVRPVTVPPSWGALQLWPHIYQTCPRNLLPPLTPSYSQGPTFRILGGEASAGQLEGAVGESRVRELQEGVPSARTPFSSSGTSPSATWQPGRVGIPAPREAHLPARLCRGPVPIVTPRPGASFPERPRPWDPQGHAPSLHSNANSRESRLTPAWHRPREGGGRRSCRLGRGAGSTPSPREGSAPPTRGGQPPGVRISDLLFPAHLPSAPTRAWRHRTPSPVSTGGTGSERAGAPEVEDLTPRDGTRAAFPYQAVSSPPWAGQACLPRDVEDATCHHTRKWI